MFYLAEGRFDLNLYGEGGTDVFQFAGSVSFSLGVEKGEMFQPVLPPPHFFLE